MTSHTTRRFRETLAGLPAHVQRQARAAYRLFANEPTHPSLRFKQVHDTRPIYSARVGLGYRALCVREGDDLIVSPEHGLVITRVVSVAHAGAAQQGLAADAASPRS